MSDRSATRMKQVRDVLLFLPRLVKLLGCLLRDPEVSTADKALVAAALAYVASPIDLIPDFVPVIGELDDIYLIAIVLLRLMNRAGEERLRLYWSGPEDIVSILDSITRVGTSFLPARVRRLVQAAVRRGDLGDLQHGGGAPGTSGP